MMKKVIIVSLFFISLFFCIENIFAGSSCKFVNLENNEEIVILIGNEVGNPIVTTTTFGEMNLANFYGSSNLGRSFWTNTEYDKTGAVQYITLEGKCPDYLYVDIDGPGEVNAYFSDKIIKSYYDGNTYESDAMEIHKDDQRYACTLSSPIYDNYFLTVEINYTKKNITFDNNFQFDGLDDYVKNFDYTTKDQAPTDLKVCVSYDLSGEKTNYIYKKDDTNIVPDSTCYDLTDSEKKEVGVKDCKNFINLMNSYNGYIDSKEYALAKNTYNRLKNFCNLITSNQTYDEYQYSCINMCWNIKKHINYTVNIASDNCGFSQRLLYWIANIVRWIKYIIPVAVIALGILDFIKAVGADKDDEMKKAQGRFVKRLIAAALIFIIPFIIEFVLDKMGFGEYISGCGIIDL